MLIIFSWWDFLRRKDIDGWIYLGRFRWNVRNICEFISKSYLRYYIERLREESGVKDREIVSEVNYFEDLFWKREE